MFALSMILTTNLYLHLNSLVCDQNQINLPKLGFMFWLFEGVNKIVKRDIMLSFFFFFFFFFFFYLGGEGSGSDR